MKKEVTIDASGRTIGRVASEAARHLMGKHLASYTRHELPQVTVVIEHAGAMRIDPKKPDQKVYARYSGYPGGLKHETLSHVLAKKGPKEAIWRAVYGMLPANKLRPRMLKSLKITE